jgi:hypothetical protein
LDGVTKEALQLKIDVTDLEAGEYEPKVSYAVPKNVSVSIIGKVKLVITEKEATTESTEESGTGPDGGTTGGGTEPSGETQTEH